jgi:hypothetical protein
MQAQRRIGLPLTVAAVVSMPALKGKWQRLWASSNITVGRRSEAMKLAANQSLRRVASDITA